MLIKKTHTVLFIPINGSGLGHLNRCLAYARHMPPSWRCVFFSLSAAIAPVLNMGYEVDYFLSHFWTTNNSTNWNRELAVRLGLLLEHVRPDVLLFDGVYPYLGLKRALLAYRKPLKLIWSRRGLQKNAGKEKDDSDLFDLVIQPGEIHDSPCRTAGADGKPPILTTPPVTLFDKEDLLPASEARRSLNLEEARRYILFFNRIRKSEEYGNRKPLANDKAPAARLFSHLAAATHFCKSSRTASFCAISGKISDSFLSECFCGTSFCGRL